MTKEEAIANIKRGKCIPYKHETLTTIIEALKTQPCDAVSRADVILIVQDIDMKSDVYEALRLIKALPSVQPQAQPCENCEKVRESYTNGFDYGVKDWFAAKTQPCDAVSKDN